MLPKSIQNLIDEFSKLPGMGPKTAARLTFYLLTKSELDTKNFGEAIINLKTGLKNCEVCFNITENNPCKICLDSNRDKSVICVAEEVLDIIALEKTNFKGLYHILGGVISPIDGIGPNELRIKELLERLKDGSVREIILATDPSLEGEATASYIASEIENLQKNGKILKKLKISRIAQGLPVGGDLEYADEVTLERAIEGRNQYK